jgi:hypothetical protein
LVVAIASIFLQQFRANPFDLIPTLRVVTVTTGQLPDSMDVVRKQTDSFDLERTPRLHFLYGPLKTASCPIIGEAWFSVVCDDGEKVDTARRAGSSVVGHITLLGDVCCDFDGFLVGQGPTAISLFL